MDKELVKKYKGIVTGALDKIEELTDDTGILVSAEGTKIKHSPARVKVDDDTLQALINLRKTMGDLITVIIDAQAEYDRLDVQPDELDARATS